MSAFKPIPLSQVGSFPQTFNGCRFNNGHRPKLTGSLTRRVKESPSWHKYFLPPTTQYGWGLCVFVATCNAIEAKDVSLYGDEIFHYPYQLDPRKYYLMKRKKEYPAEIPTDGGAELHHGFEALWEFPEIAILPEPVEIKRTGDIELAMEWHRKFPLLVGMIVTNGWDPVNMSTHGNIDEYYPPEHSFSGHAVCFDQFMPERNGMLYPAIYNGGWYDWGMNGVGVMSHEYFRRSLLDEFVWPDIPDDMWPEIHQRIKNNLTTDWGAVKDYL